jgi:DNA gyrase subunit A
VFISQNGMIQRIGVRDLRPLGRNAQGFRLMNVREDDLVSAVALVVESEASDAVAADGPVSVDASGVADEPALEGDAVFIGDPDEEGLLSVPEVDADEMPDSGVEDDE